MSRPVRIDQVIPSIVERDAVSQHTLEAQRVLRSMGFVSEIYACTMGPGLGGRVHELDALPRAADGSQWVCYQASIGSPAAEVFAGHPGRKLVNYHNITPVELVERWMPTLGEEVRLGRRQLDELAYSAEIGIAVSEFNRAELEVAGYRRTAVSPLMASPQTLETAPHEETLSRLSRAKSIGGQDWLFVGQMLPHKAHADLIKAFAALRRIFDPNARLHLVGRPSCAPYVDALHRFAYALGLRDAIDFAGSISAGELAAYFATADCLVCCSDHEGFCAPLIEAMGHGVPVIAYGAAAVPETVLDAGIVLPSKSPVLVAAAAHRVATDRALRTTLVAAGQLRASDFTLERARRSFAGCVELALSSQAAGRS